MCLISHQLVKNGHWKTDKKCPLGRTLVHRWGHSDTSFCTIMLPWISFEQLQDLTELINQRCQKQNPWPALTHAPFPNCNSASFLKEPLSSLNSKTERKKAFWRHESVISSAHCHLEHMHFLFIGICLLNMGLQVVSTESWHSATSKQNQTRSKQTVRLWGELWGQLLAEKGHELWVWHGAMPCDLRNFSTAINYKSKKK